MFRIGIIFYLWSKTHVLSNHILWFCRGNSRFPFFFFFVGSLLLATSHARGSILLSFLTRSHLFHFLLFKCKTMIDQASFISTIALLLLNKKKFVLYENKYFSIYMTRRYGTVQKPYSIPSTFKCIYSLYSHIHYVA